MITYMNDAELKELSQVQSFTNGTNPIRFKPASQTESYTWIAGTLKRFDYFKLSKGDRGTVRSYLTKVTGYSRAQLNRLILQYKKKRWIGERRQPRNCFTTRYTREDILLLAETDECHQTLSGPATKKLFERGYNVFKEARYERLADISVAHIYNLRRRPLYQNRRRHFTKTQRSMVAIGERRKPQPNGKPGYLRIDTVHQGDQDQVKGVYHINAVDEVTQMEVICAVEKISEHYLIPVLEQLIELFPFEIKEIHADNGSEYINHTVVRLLNKLLIELTKSRSRQSNDNALVESKNGSIVRKWLGYCHIPQKHAPEINEFFKKHLVPYINYHRPCHYAVIKVDEKTGKQRKTYPYENMMTPYEKFKSLPGAKQYLKAGVTFAELDAVAGKETDLEAARKTQKAREKLFQIIVKTA
jgi:transposase InsO family protein